MKLLLIGVYQSLPLPGDKAGHWFLRITDPKTNKSSDATLFEAQALELINDGIPRLPNGGGL